MSLPAIEIYSSIECPFAYLAIYRLRQVWPDYRGRVRVVWRALSLEYINRSGSTKPLTEAELDLLTRIEPGLPANHWPRPDWEWPATMWPAFEALACAQAQGHDEAFAMSWALRRGFFEQGRSPAMRHELFSIAREVAGETGLDIARFEDDWDSGRYKSTVIGESRRGWHELKLEGSATFVLPNNRRVTNPAVGAADFDEAAGRLRSYTPYQGDPRGVYRALLEEAARGAA
jgi:predicted DsbA family dithiol-disulfide isomerase